MFVESAAGAAVYEDQNGRVQRGVSGSAMAGSYRLKGGIGQIITELDEAIPENLIHKNNSVVSVSLAENGIGHSSGGRRNTGMALSVCRGRFATESGIKMDRNSPRILEQRELKD